MTSKLADPQWRIDRARKAAHARTAPEALIRRLQILAPDLTDEERGLLAAILATPRRAE